MKYPKSDSKFEFLFRGAGILGEEGFESGTEITFNCIKGAAGERTTWKISCEDGIWRGRSFDCSTVILLNPFLLPFRVN